MSNIEVKELKKKRKRGDHLTKQEKAILKQAKQQKKESKESNEQKESKESSDSKKLKKSNKPKVTQRESNDVENVQETNTSSEYFTLPDAKSTSDFLEKNEIKVENIGQDAPLVITKFSQINVDSRIMKSFAKFSEPTPIQAVSWPYLLSGKDVVGVAETGSGKTLAFGFPSIVHLLESEKSKVLIVSPTRELARQIHETLEPIAASCGIKSVCIYGGVPKDAQREHLKTSRIVVATPGRLNDFLEEGSANLKNADYVVLDEADRMLEKGFERDIKQIISACTKSSKQMLMFTATWPAEVREIASNFMRSPVKINIGDRDELKANTRIEQVVEVVDPRDKESRLLEILQKETKNKKEKIIIFALYKKEATRVEEMLTRRGYKIAAIHGDLSQDRRTQALEQFKTSNSHILLATDVAARGLDIPSVGLVINLTFPLTVEDYVHRIGRTGRAGSSGRAFTFFTVNEKHLSGALINVLKAADQPVPVELMKFGTHTKKKEHSAYGAFYKEIDPSAKSKKIKFD
ncbi:hypothetical protein CANCADRAFT_44241 [Tortispora caseinolytica NRRL Y-17796]|uniref:ATP-dependent RNA helicase DBP3 n=1 Tax=Tortispora caseinolytica NRRL Y-17796 TaxID=767744 RepID=A0A1E4TFW5_9ASCO|nr:hypothetical protein CANCADRAFT_44241 [Tortispora caseinolytica NRRL Y-17796]